MISTNFLQEKYMSKTNTKETKPKHKAVENIKYQPILNQLVL